MRSLLTKIENFLAGIYHKITDRFAEKKAEKDSSEKPRGLFDKLDRFLLRFDGSFLIWSFFLSAALMLLVYVAMDVYPFGKSSVLVLDLNGQYVQFFAGLRAILHGDGSLLYSFSRSLGGEFLGIYAYYLASPLSWIVAIFPEKNILEALLVIFVLKSGFAGLNFGAFLHYTRRPPKPLTVAISILYAMSSYTVVMQHNTMWMDAMMLLPLLLLGLERLIRHKKPILYTVTLGVTLLANYYIGYMMCIFTAIYFFYLFLAHDSENLNPRGERRHFFSSLLRTGVYTLLGIGIAAMLLLPAYYSLTFGKTTFSEGNFAFTTKFNILDFITKMFPGSYDTVRPEGLPWVYAGTVSLILLPLFFMAGRISVREKIASGAILFILFLSMYINTFDVLWHGGQAPNWLNYRYSFVFIFFVLLLAARAITVLHSVDYRAILAVAAFWLLVVVILQKINPTYTVAGVTKPYFDNLSGVWFSIGFLVVYATILLFLNGHDRTSPRLETIATIMVAVLCVELLLNGIFYLRKQHEDVTISSYASYHDFYDVYDAPFDYVKENDDEPFYRMDMAFQRYVTDSFVLGYRGLASSTSTLNADVVAFQHALGMKANSHWTSATGSTIASNSLLGVKYWIAKDKAATDANGSPVNRLETELFVDPFYTEHRRDEESMTVTYLNPYALPIAFTSTDAIRDLTYEMPAEPKYAPDNSVQDYGGYTYRDGAWVLSEEWENTLWSPFLRLNATYSALSGYRNLSVFEAVEATVRTTGSMEKKAEVWSHTPYTIPQKEDTASRIEFTLTAPKDGAPIYCYFPTKYPREATIYINGKLRSYYTNGNTKNEKQSDDLLYPDCAGAAQVFSIGSFAEGETVTVSLSIEKYGEFYLVEDTPYFYTLNEEALATATARISAGGISLTRADDDHFEGTITAREGYTTVQTTIPYDAGWQITVNGEKVEGYKTLGALLAFDLPKSGTYEVEMLYRPSLYTLGLILSIVAILVTAAILTVILLRDKRRIKISDKNILGRALLFFLPDVRELPDAEPSEGKEESGLFKRKTPPADQADRKEKRRR